MDSTNPSAVNDSNSEMDNTVEVPLSSESSKKERKPRRVLHFCDGTLEEYSTDEDEKCNSDEVDAKKTDASNQLLTADRKNMYWSTWFWIHVVTAGSATLGVCDYLGEKLAAFFGITTPKYEYEIDYYKSVKAEEEEQQKRQDLEMGGWTGDSKTDKTLIDDNVTVTTKERLLTNSSKDNGTAV